MSDAASTCPIDEVTPGDVVAVDRGAGEKLVKVVFKDGTDDGYRVTLEDAHGETFQLDLPAGTPVKAALESKWESGQSPTPHSDR